MKHPADTEALRIYDKLWASANEARYKDGDPFIADHIEKLAADLYLEIKERELRR